jgi:hypothetical protein
VSTFHITYRPDTALSPEQVEADRCDVEADNGWLVLRRVVLVVGQPRDVVVRRIEAGTVLSLTEVPTARPSSISRRGGCRRSESSPSYPVISVS